MVLSGIDVFMSEKGLRTGDGRIGLLCNHASVNGRLQHSRVLLQARFGSDMTCLFSPQHGFSGEKQDNMIESDHSVDTLTGLPVYSLYGESRKPTKEMFDCLDTLYIDVVDVGTRVYTFMYTMAYCLEAARQYGKKVVILDRPNPIGGETVEGNLLEPDCSSFVGLYPLPMRHGLTFAELALYINTEFRIGAELEIVKMRGWKRAMYYRDTGLVWVYPSPNMPTPETAMVYPGQVIWEGTMVSEGRGTTLPFELVGAPYFKPADILDRLDDDNLSGCHLRVVTFEPTSGKYAGIGCHGFQLHVLEKDRFRPYRTSLALLQAVLQLYPEEFSYKDPPYEYEYKRRPIDLILGSTGVRKQLEDGVSIQELEQQWRDDLEAYDAGRREYFLYS